MYVTRFAPSPTGLAHMGNFRTCYFSWLAARASGGKFLLRLDDTNQERHNAEAEKVILDTMEWLGLDYDIYFKQSERTKRYTDVASMLLDCGDAVYLDNNAVALTWNDKFPRVWHDEIAGDIPITDTNIEQINGRLILLRGGDKIGQPTYQFCSVVDDYDYGINYIIRGVDHQTNTPKQLAIWWAIYSNEVGLWEFSRTLKPQPIPRFAHVGLIFKDKKKLSKRDNAASMLNYKDDGYAPDALLNFMLRMGWAPTVDNKENSIISTEKAVKMFLTEGRMRASNASFDAQKLDWYQRMYTK